MKFDEFEVERVQVYTPQAGDVIVLQLQEHATPPECARVSDSAKQLFGPEVKIAVLGAGIRFEGVVRESEVA